MSVKGAQRCIHDTTFDNFMINVVHRTRVLLRRATEVNPEWIPTYDSGPESRAMRSPRPDPGCDHHCHPPTVEGEAISEASSEHIGILDLW